MSVTQLIQDWRAGSTTAEAELLKMVYPSIKEIAGRQLRKSKQLTLRPTELANDVFMKMREQTGWGTENSSQFYALAARIIRFLIVDHIRERLTEKRGSGHEFVELEFATSVPATNTPENFDWLALDDALTALEQEDKRHVTLIELRYFMGMSTKQASEVMQISTATADRIWRYARVFLANRLGGQSGLATG